jgi:hypothetical protein
MGMISYTIKRKNPLPLGTQFTNRAGIYFDFNAPVQTNTTLNTLAGPAGTSTALLDNSQVTVYPNPVQDVLHAKLSGLKAQENILISVANISGQVISTTQITSSNGHDEITLPTDQLKPGLYFVSFQTQHGTQTKKFVKE